MLHDKIHIIKSGVGPLKVRIIEFCFSVTTVSVEADNGRKTELVGEAQNKDS